MITAIDTNILLDILIPDEAHSLSSKRLLDRCLEKGQLVICEVVYAELSSQFPSEGELRNFLSDTGIRLIHSSREVLYLAGERWRTYTRKRERTIQCPHCGEKISITCPKCDQTSCIERSNTRRFYYWSSCPPARRVASYKRSRVLSHLF